MCSVRTVQRPDIERRNDVAVSPSAGGMEDGGEW